MWQYGVMAERNHSPTPELWDKKQAAAYLNMHPNSVRKWAWRRNIPIADRRIDDHGRSHALYRADDIRNNTQPA